MAAKWIEALTGSLEEKKLYKEAQARLDALPAPYAKVAQAIQRYLMYYGGVTDGESMVRMNADLADLWERAAADGTLVHDIVGSDPVDFAETFGQSYSGKQWIDKERARLVKAVEEAERGQ
ncbi:DUF1048 domain-containing protein [Pseudoclavibacter sp. RFBB5]|uniref:DUF1048 domain-containing protein n=1 Tax=Pseudoclavibacter sp. RFBB5 TaxID=2080574 RepID=UPI000CE7B3D0|nr:DUF1048 domain-containing protein [Pseudoclavibacter sp. RFBB5]PPG32131.1 hypothetical protein C5B97_03440 [Pseudoclavibacter sp. RFBB5]